MHGLGLGLGLGLAQRVVLCIGTNAVDTARLCGTSNQSFVVVHSVNDDNAHK